MLVVSVVLVEVLVSVVLVEVLVSVVLVELDELEEVEVDVPVDDVVLEEHVPVVLDVEVEVVDEVEVLDDVLAEVPDVQVVPAAAAAWLPAAMPVPPPTAAAPIPVSATAMAVRAFPSPYFRRIRCLR